MKSTIIEIYGGPGCGKSTTAAGLYYQLKLLDKNAELVREYVKKWAWDGILPRHLDQLYITGKQSKAESMLYGKVDFIVTDCPLYMGVIYDAKYNKSFLVEDAVTRFNAESLSQVERYRYLLTRSKPFNPSGRFCSAEGAAETDQDIRNYLDDKGLDYLRIGGNPNTQVFQILKDLARRGAIELGPEE